MAAAPRKTKKPDPAFGQLPAPFRAKNAIAETGGLLGAPDDATSTTDAANRGKGTHNPPANAKRKAAAGTKNHAASQQGQQRADKPYVYGKADRFPDLGLDIQFRFVALHAGSSKRYPLRVERCTWQDSNAITTGEITLRIPLGESPSAELRLDQGDRIVLEGNEGHGWVEVWTMRCYKPQLTGSNASRSFSLVNDLDLLRQSEDNFLFDRTRAHPHAWKGDEIIKWVCAKYRVPIGSIYKATGNVGKLHVRRGSPLAVIRNVLVRERRRHNRRLFVRFDKGKLNVLPLQRSPHLLALGPTLIEAQFQSELPPQFGSAVTMHALRELIEGSQDIHGRVKGKVQKGHVEVPNPEAIKRFGYVHRIVYSPDATTDALLRQEATAYISAVTVPRKTLTVSHKGMPWLRRGDAIQLAIGDEGLKRQIVWVNQVQHNLTAESYTSDVTVIFDDPYRDITQESILFRLKATHDEAVGDRARLNPLWNFPPNNKGDAAVTASQDPFTTPVPLGQTGSSQLDPGGLNSPGGPFG